MSDDEIEEYGDQYISSKDAKVPGFLKWTYILCPIWGVVWLFYFCNGSYGWLDRGYWNSLQRAANTTFPSENVDNPKVWKQESLAPDKPE